MTDTENDTTFERRVYYSQFPKGGGTPTTPGHMGRHQSGSEQVRRQRAREGKRGPAPFLRCPQEGLDKAGQPGLSSGLVSLNNFSSKRWAAGGSSAAPGQCGAGRTLTRKVGGCGLCTSWFARERQVLGQAVSPRLARWLEIRASKIQKI